MQIKGFNIHFSNIIGIGITALSSVWLHQSVDVNNVDCITKSQSLTQEHQDIKLHHQADPSLAQCLLKGFQKVKIFYI